MMFQSKVNCLSLLFICSSNNTLNPSVMASSCIHYSRCRPKAICKHSCIYFPEMKLYSGHHPQRDVPGKLQCLCSPRALHTSSQSLTVAQDSSPWHPRVVGLLFLLVPQPPGPEPAISLLICSHQFTGILEPEPQPEVAHGGNQICGPGSTKA